MPQPTGNLKIFATRMFTLTIITSLLICLCTPVTYLCVAWKAKQLQAAALGYQVANDAQAILISNPESKEQHQLQLNNLITFYKQNPDIKHLKISTNWSKHESYVMTSPPSFFDIIQRVDIIFNGTNHGYVELTVTETHIIISTILLTGIFCGFGLLINNLLYRLPVSIVSENEKSLHSLTEKLKKVTGELSHAKNMLEQTAMIDCQTGLYSNGQIVKRLEEDMSKVSLHGGSLSILLLDIDYFKQYNDYCGYESGDKALATVATLLKAQIRGHDLAGRFSGEKFLVILPNVDQNQAAATADRLRISVESHPFPQEEHLPGGRFTISIGVSAYTGGSLTAQQLIAQADHSLSQAKEAGRNQVAIYQTIGEIK